MTEASGIQVQLTEQDYLSANRLHSRLTRWLWIYLGALIGYAAIFVMFSDSQDLSLDRVAIMPVVIVFVGLTLWMSFVRYLLVPWNVRRIYQQQKQLQRPQFVSWDDDALSTQGSDFSVKTAWSDFLKWRENDRLFSIYFSDISFRMVTKRAFANEAAIADFRRLLQRHIAPKPGQKRSKV